MVKKYLRYSSDKYVANLFSQEFKYKTVVLSFFPEVKHQLKLAERNVHL